MTNLVVVVVALLMMSPVFMILALMMFVGVTLHSDENEWKPQTYQPMEILMRRQRRERSSPGSSHPSMTRAA